MLDNVLSLVYYNKYTKGQLYIMKKMILLFFVVYIWFYSIFNAVNSAHASEVTKDLSDYNKAVIGHVITNMSDIDKRELLENELAKIGHQYALEMLGVMQELLPIILDGAISELRQKTDTAYKCELLKDTEMSCK